MMYLAFVSKQMTPYQVTDYLLRSVQPELATIDGVGKAGIFGRYLAMRIWLDPGAHGRPRRHGQRHQPGDRAGTT
jgi:multidrug efflux pump subunit AcrB